MKPKQDQFAAPIDIQSLYYQALFIAFKRFIEEEKKGNSFTELRLMASIEAARTLYLKQIVYFISPF